MIVIFIAGASAGGGLGLALTLKLRDENKDLLNGVIALSAWEDLSNTPKLAKPYVKDNDPKNPYISPVYGDYGNFPRLLLQVGEEKVTNDSIIINEEAKDNNVEVYYEYYEEMSHVF